MQGTRVGQYELQRVLGRGAFGEVWLALDHRLGREVAIKRLKPEIVGDADARRRFDSEAETLLKVNEPHVVQVLDRIEIEGAPALVTEYMEGGSLADLKKTRQEPFPVEDVQRWCEQAALGLAAVHSRGILHRDIKPANLFLSHDGNLSLGDFGLARSVDKTQTLGLQGTAPYMSPEQIRGAELDARSDLFSLGIAMYELMTGERPFGDGLDRVERSDSADSLRSGVPAEFSDTIEALLEPDIDKRVQSADELLARLRGQGPGRYVRVPPRRRFALATAVLVAIVAAVAFGRPLLSPPPPHECDLEPIPGRRIVVMPFEYHGSQEFERLGGEIPALLASSLNGVDGVDAPPPETYMSCPVRPEPSLKHTGKDEEWMEEHRIRLVVAGVITELSGRLRIDLSFRYFNRGKLWQYEDASLTLGEIGEALEAVNDIGLEVMRHFLRDPGDDLAREVLAAGTSLEALSAFLSGHRALCNLQMGYPDFGKAAALDSTMALAYYDESMVAGILHQGDDRIREFLQSANRHKDRLGPYGRLLLEAANYEVNREMGKAESTLLEAITTYADRPWAQLRLANLHYQHNSSRGRSITESRREFELAQQLDPGNIMAGLFLQWLELMEGDDEAIEARFGELPPPQWQLLAAFTSGSQADRDSVLASQDFCSGDITAFNLMVLCYPDNHRNVIDFLTPQICAGTSTEDSAWMILTLAHLNAGIGRWNEASRLFATVPAPFRAFELEYEALALSLPFIPADEARIRNLIGDLETWRPLDASSRVDPLQDYMLRQRFEPHLGVHEHLRLYCLAALQARLGEVTASRAVLGQLRTTPIADNFRDFKEDLIIMGEARIAFVAKDYTTALAQLERVRQFRYMDGNYSAMFQRSDARYLRARCLVELGRHEEALGWFDAADDGTEFLRIYTTAGHLGQAGALEALQRTDDAARHYRSFIDLMDGCDPEYDDEVAKARERLKLVELDI